MVKTDQHVVIVGAGPAGAVLGYILAARGMRVTLLEGCADFNRDFRGDTLHASSLEILDQLGLAEQLLPMCHGRIEKLGFQTENNELTIADFRLLNSRFNCVELIPQERFLGFMVEQASRFANFKCIMNARVHALQFQGEKVSGVEYHLNNEKMTLNADLVIGADGRGSAVRREAGLELMKTAPPMDILWFRLPRDREHHSADAVTAHFGKGGAMLIRLARDDEWQLGYVLIKGSYKQLREQGLQAFQDQIKAMQPELENVISNLDDWSKCAILSVVCGRVKRWYRAGLLLIGDAAHIMSPIGGVGINYAIQDAVAAANVLVTAINSGSVTENDLQQVQVRREMPVKFIQKIQGMIQNNVIANALKSDKPFQPPLPLRILARTNSFRKFMAKILAYGLKPEKLQLID